MHPASRRSACSLLLLLGVPSVVACKDGSTQDSVAPNFVGPLLEHTPEVSVGQGGELSITLTASDEDGLGSVSMYHRTGGVMTWALLPMTPGPDDTFTATLSGDDLVYPSVEYYFKATDAADVPATSYLPTNDTTASPFAVAVTVAGAPLPFVEDFEPDDGGDPLSLDALGWGAASTEFRGYPWQTSQAQALSGSSSAFHPQGYADAAPSRDWLISPAIDLTSVSTAQVSWQEYGNFAAAANHALYISTTGRAPTDDATNPYTLVTALPAPQEDAWGRSQVVDLSAWAGQTVYLAWYFEGTGADDWYVDDVRVEALQADLSESWAIAPDPVHPGESTTLTVTVVNTATVAAEDVAVSLAFPDGLVSGDAAPVVIGEVAAGGTATADFVVTVDADAPDNRYVPMQITVDSGAGPATTDDSFLVGYASTASVGWNATADGSLQLVVGVGDPDAPTWSTTVYADTAVAGPLDLSVDITDAGDLLPAAAGQRWWAEATTAAGGSFTDFTIAYGGVPVSATVLPAVPALGSDVCYLPEPPAFAVTATTSPATLAPGTSNASLALVITDTGAATSGPVTATLSSTDPDVTVTDGGPLAVGADAFDAGDRVNLSGFRFSVSSAHTDSTDVNLDLTLDDGVESWLVPLSFDVPYPVFTVTSVDVNDDGGDGLLDPDESATLKIYVTNTGDQNASGNVTGVLSVAGTSVALADVQAGSEVLGSLAAGATQDARFDVTVIGGAGGDPLDLQLVLTDSLRSYTTTTQLVLGEPPWSALSTTDDADNDALAGWDFDMVNGSYRVVDGMMQLRMRSSVVYDPRTLFVEAWGTASGADYIYYRIVAQSGGATLEGYDSASGFRSLPDPTLSYPDATTIQVEFPVSDLGLFSDRIQLGFGSGWCGAPEYYCDQFPDLWGYPYDSFSTADWFTLEW